MHTRSELSVQDENSKLGTLLDGEQIRGQSKVLKNDEHVVKLGSFEQLYRWVNPLASQGAVSDNMYLESSGTPWF